MRMDYDERRRLILSAATGLFLRHPYEQVSVSDIAKAAGVAKGLLHHYFGSKRELYLEVVREVVRVPTLPVPEDADELSVEQVWEASVDGWMRLIEANPELWLAAATAGGAGRDAEVEAILDESKEVVVERALQALGVAELAPDELRAICRGYGAFTEEITREWLQRGRLSRAQARTALLRTLPLLVEHLLPEVLEERRERRAPQRTGATSSTSKPSRSSR